jgi:hypothetical protein
MGELAAKLALVTGTAQAAEFVEVDVNDKGERALDI